MILFVLWFSIEMIFVLSHFYARIEVFVVWMLLKVNSIEFWFMKALFVSRFVYGFLLLNVFFFRLLDFSCSLCKEFIYVVLSFFLVWFDNLWMSSRDLHFDAYELILFYNYCIITPLLFWFCRWFGFILVFNIEKFYMISFFLFWFYDDCLCCFYHYA